MEDALEAWPELDVEAGEGAPVPGVEPSRTSEIEPALSFGKEPLGVEAADDAPPDPQPARNVSSTTVAQTAKTRTIPMLPQAKRLRARKARPQVDGDGEETPPGGRYAAWSRTRAGAPSASGIRIGRATSW